MDYDEIFQAYYTQYRAEATVPTSADDEYTVGIPLANEAINRWSKYDNTMWKELFTTRVIEADGDATVVAGQTNYAAPDNMQLAGGYVKITNSTGAVLQRYPILEPQEAQFKSDNSSFSYFIGDPNNGFTLVLNPAPVAGSPIIGGTIDYVYYKKPTKFEVGADITEMADPYFIVHRMLANRFRSSRNPYYGSAKSDAEDSLRTMQLTNNSGNWADPWSLQDHSGSQWGA